MEKRYTFARNRIYNISFANKSDRTIKILHATGDVEMIRVPSGDFNTFRLQTPNSEVTLDGEEFAIGSPSEGISSGARDKNNTATSRIADAAEFCAPILGGGALYSVGDRYDPNLATEFIQLRAFDIGSESIATQSISDLIMRDDFAKETMRRAPEPKPKAAARLRIAVVLHLHSADLWEEFEIFIRAIPITVKLFVSIRHDDKELRRKILTAFPDAQVVATGSTGRDIKSFLELIWTGSLDEFDLICKLNSMKSDESSGGESAFGLLCRRRALLDLIGDGQSASKIIDRFTNVDGIGMIGPAQLRVPSALTPGGGDATTWSDRFWLAGRAEIDRTAIENQYCAGSMFWARREALDPLRRLNPGSIDWTPERRQPGGQIEHAMECFFADCVRATGFFYADADPYLGSDVTRAAKIATGNSRREIAPHALFHDMAPAFAHRWEITPPDELEECKVALFCIFAPKRQVNAYTETFLRELRDAGYFVVLCAVVQDVTSSAPDSFRAHADAVFLRENGGFDFAIWAEALRTAPQLWRSGCILFANDSVVGPLNTFQQLVKKMEETVADCIALTESQQVSQHFQSYFFELRSNALQHKFVRDFFEHILCWRRKYEVTLRYEVPLLRCLRDICKLNVEIMYPICALGDDLAYRGNGNPTIDYWKELLDLGYPFVKTELLRDLANENFADIVDAGRKSGLDVDRLMLHLEQSRLDRKNTPYTKEELNSSVHNTKTPRIKKFRRKIMRLIGMKTKKERRQARIIRSHIRKL